MATRTIGTEIVLSGEKQFNDAMKSVNSNLKNLKSDMALVTAEFEGNANSSEALTKKQKILQESTEQHRAKVDALRRMYEKTKEASGENSAAADKLKRELNNATVALIKEENALKKNADALDQLRKDADAAAAAEEEARLESERLAKEQKIAAERAAKLAKAQKEEAEAAEKAAKKQELHTKRMEAAHKRAAALESAFKSLGTATLAASKVTVAGAAALSAAGTAALTGMIALAKEAAERAKAAHEAGEEMSASEIEWFKMSQWLDNFGDSADRAKDAIAIMLLPVLQELSIKGGSFLERFSRDMEAAAGNTEKQAELLGKYIAEGALKIAESLPQYVEVGKSILSGIGKGLSESDEELLAVGLDLMKGLLTYLSDNAHMFAESGLEFVLELIEGIDGKDLSGTAAKLATRLSDAIAEKSPEMLPAAVALIGEFQLGLAENSPQLIESGAYLIAQLAVGIFNALLQWRDTADLVVDTMVDRLEESHGSFIGVGARIIGWIAEGILSGWGGLFSMVTDVVQDRIAEKTAAAINTSVTTSGVTVPGSVSALDRYADELLGARDSNGIAYDTKKNKYSEVNIYTSSLSQSDLDLVFSYVNDKLGG